MKHIISVWLVNCTWGICACVHTHISAYWISNIYLFVCLPITYFWPKQLKNQYSNKKLHLFTTVLSQQPKGENNTNIHQQMNKEPRCDIAIQQIYSTLLQYGVLILPDHHAKWQETVTKDLIHHATHQVHEERNNELIRPPLTYSLVQHVWQVFAVWGSQRWTPGTLNRWGHLSSYLNRDPNLQSESWILFTKSSHKGKRLWEA